MLTKEELPPCPVATCFQLFGNKWKIYIIQQLIEQPLGFNALHRSIPGISQKVLSSNLKEMDAAGLITRTVIPETPIRTEYALSELVKALCPSSILLWNGAPTTSSLCEAPSSYGLLQIERRGAYRSTALTFLCLLLKKRSGLHTAVKHAQLNWTGGQP